MKKDLKLSRELLEELYVHKKLSSLKIAKLLNIKHSKSVRRTLKRYGIKIRTLSEAGTKKFKAQFDNDLRKKAFLIGLRAGDFYAKQKNKSIRMQTSTTHSAQIELLRKSFENYGEIKTYLTRNKIIEDEWFIYVDLDSSFSFLLEKPECIPIWILENNDYFNLFLAAYTDCEGNWHFSKSHEKHARFGFRIRSSDKKILIQIKQKMGKLGYSARLYLDRKKGSMTPRGSYNNDLFNLTINQKKDVLRLAQTILPLSRHSEKIRKMQLFLENKDKRWHQIKPLWDMLKKDISNELLKNSFKPI